MALTVIIASDGHSEEHTFAGDVTIGRAPDNALVLPSETVSRHHARIRAERGRLHLADLGSANGTMLDGRALEPRVETPFEDGQAFVIPPYSLVARWVPDPGDTILTPSPAVARRDPVNVGRATTSPLEEPTRRIQAEAGVHSDIVIGRDATCDLVVDHPAVSRRHARVSTRGEGRLIEDLGSSNGTFLNGLVLVPGEPRAITDGDRLRIGPVALVLHAGVLHEPDESRAVSLDAFTLERHVGGTNLLKQVSVAIRPHEFVAIVGVSGAGKSTLVGALSGLQPASKGTVLINGAPLYEHWAAFRTTLGFVPQDDILHKELSVEKALSYAAALRLPSDTTPEERAKRVDETMATLGLVGRRHVSIQRLSGGERKRVSIGAELLTQPGLFFLDEATSGLDPGTESQLMRLLRGLADEGQTVIIVTHATKNVMLCDQVVFLARGGYLAFFGPPDAALQHFAVDDFDGIYRKLEGEVTPDAWAERFRASPHFQVLNDRLAEVETAPAGARTTANANRRAGPRPISSLAQLFLLTRRSLEIIRHDRMLVAILLLIAPVIGAIDFVSTNDNVFASDGGSTPKAMTFLFLTALFPFMIGALAAVREIVKEDAIYRRERSVAIGIAPYVLSKVVVAFVFALYHAAALTMLKRLAVDIPAFTTADFGALYVTIVLTVLSGALFGLVISAFTTREEQAMMLAVAVIIVQVVFSGALVSLRELGPAGTVLGGVTSTQWAFRAGTTATGLSLEQCDRASLGSCDLPGFASLDDESARRVTFDGVVAGWEGIYDTPLLFSWAAMLTILAVLCGALYLLQRRKDTH